VNGTLYDANNTNGIERITSKETGCDSLILEVSVNFEAVTAFVSTIDPTCEGLDNGSLIIESVSGSTPPYRYSINNSPVQIIPTLPFEVEGLEAGDYTIQILSDSDCASSLTSTILEGPTPVVDLGEDLLIELGTPVTITPSINFDYDQLNWQPATMLPCDTCQSLEFIPPASIDIFVTASDSLGCLASDQLSILVDATRKVFQPNVFSPDLDGINDKFMIFADPDQVVEIRTFQIYDRWGELVFVRNFFQPNDPQLGWDGTFRGAEAPAEVYVYYAELEFVDGIIEIVKGSVTLVR